MMLAAAMVMMVPVAGISVAVTGHVGQADAVPATPPSPGQDKASDVDQGDIVVTARQRHAPGDPLETMNLKLFGVTQSLDKSLAGPVAMGYKRTIPSPVRTGLRNFLGNLDAPVVFLNDLLQFKPARAGRTLGRFTVNSTIGVGGFFDVAKRDPLNLPYRRNGFANTLGYYGVKTGAYVYLPFVGPTTIRDMVGGVADTFVLPLSVGTPFNSLYYTIPTTAISALDDRAEFDDQIQAFRRTVDPYVTYRNYYLARRKAEILALHSAKYRAAHPVEPPAVPKPGFSQ